MHDVDRFLQGLFSGVADQSWVLDALSVGKPNRITLPTHAVITAEVCLGSPNRYVAAKWRQP